MLADDNRCLRRVAAAIGIRCHRENNYTHTSAGAHRAARRPLSHARRVPGQRLQRGRCASPAWPRPTRAGVTHVVHELSVHVAAALGNAFLVEWIDWIPGDLFEGMPRIEDGDVVISERAGHGVALAADAIRKYRAA